ncbi:MAG: N-acetyltransferase [Candidatus Marinimicrobia bacterium]|nr:N-acetyltransferase [Candidatus Neomarinimicrobiota bacterium]MBL7009731.1 N-acetyltransferase [Candidatus Neomarinimicrobiota bacterium]MBL7029865.1 N-acetyltransferase [Candidatus Neomarinimicrobiota bacterium]
MQIRPEKREDCIEISKLNDLAFGGTDEGKIIHGLRQNANPIISIIAEENSEILGHIIFSPVILSTNPSLPIMGLGPMAVKPENQHSGIGTKLVYRGLKACREINIKAVVVLGHPTYYPRFGFAPAIHFGISSEYDVPKDAFMIKELQDDILLGEKGIVKYHSTFESF